VREAAPGSVAGARDRAVGACERLCLAGLVG
jgi:hypothetical protein